MSGIVVSRVIGIRPRVLKRKDESASPTQIHISEPGKKIQFIEMTEQEEELDFLLGCYPMTWRSPDVDEDVSAFAEHHKKWTKAQEEEPLVHASQKEYNKKVGTWTQVKLIPATFEGIRTGDRVVMSLGGPGRTLARDICEDGENNDVQVWRCAPYKLKDARDAANLTKDQDAQLLTEMFRAEPGNFHLMRHIEVNMASLMTIEYRRQQLMRDRIAAGNQLRQEAPRTLLAAKRAGQPIDTLEAAHKLAMKTDEKYVRLEQEEKRALEDLGKLLETIPVWTEILQHVEGLGVSIGARIIAGIGDIRAFMVEPTVEQRTEIDTLSAQINNELTAGHYEEGKRAIRDELDGRCDFDRIVAVCRFWNNNGFRNRADALGRALKLVQKRGKLARKAHKRGESKFRAICNVHVNADGTFPRFRAGGTDGPKGRPALKLAMHLLRTQWNMRPKGAWGQRLLANKQIELQKHPTPVESGRFNDKGKPIMLYTPGHLLHRAQWKTLTQFVNWLFKKWTALERATK